jgi:photosystem II stability/assembly factor-like uncharacterized protein
MEAARMSFSICIATTGAGLWTSHDGGKRWLLSHCDNPPYPYELCARAVAVNPVDGTVWASIDSEHAEDVVARSNDRGETYQYVAVPAPGRQIWALAVDPHHPQTLLAGSRPGGVFRSTDSGATWEPLPVGIAETASIGMTRVTSIAYTERPGEVWVSVEIDGLWHSLDGGDSWEKHHLSGGEALLGPEEVWKDERHFDIHEVLTGPGGEEGGLGSVYVAAPIGFFASEDSGQTWRGSRYPIEGDYDWSLFYSRSLYAHPERRGEVLVGLGRRPADHGTLGGIQRSEDGGRSWRPVSPILRSVVWKMAGHPHDPDVIAAVTLFGQVLVSTDAGQSWSLSEREFGEIRGVAVVG